MIANLSTESLDTVRVFLYLLVKEYARPYEALRERAAVCDFLFRAVTVIAMEKPSSIRDLTPLLRRRLRE
jgi:hypothetical protein